MAKAQTLKEKYINEVSKSMQKDLKLGNALALPNLKKIVINSGIGSIKDNKDSIESFVSELTAITGQKPYPRKARKSEAGFNIRQGETIGYSVTLRGDRMWEFLNKLINVVLPRVRDFRGLNPKAFDKAGNYSLGIKEHVIFPEVDPNKVKNIRSMQITMVTDSDDLEANKLMFDKLGMPFKKI